MILVDTSVWVDHLLRPDAMMLELLRDNNVLMHAMVIGELACGNLPDRAAKMAMLRVLPRISESSNDAVTGSVEQRKLMGRGIGFVDAHLVLSVVERQDTRFWTRDCRLHRVANELGVAFVDGGGDG